jgi:SAM-dependent methyltransferase
MKMGVIGLDQAGAAYEVLAPYYDDFTSGYQYEQWVAAIEERALALGLRGRRALDLACGTGNSTGPLLARGYSVLGCDISPAMIAEARRKYPGQADSFLVADMRELPALGQFDLVLCLDDAVNYLLSADDLSAAFSGVARLLSPSGIFVFDVNSLLTYRTTFAAASVTERAGVLLAWQGDTEPEFAPGDIGTARVAIFAERDDGLWERRSMRHVQRHHSSEAVRGALAGVGLACVLAGQHPGAHLEDTFNEERHIKVVYFAWRARARPARRAPPARTGAVPSRS